MNPDQPAAPVAGAIAIQHEPSVGQMLQQFLQSPEGLKNVEVAERMFALYERAEARNAEKAFNAAFVKLQSELPVIVAKTVIPNRGKYEKFEDVMEQIAPCLKNNGFSVSFSQDFKENRILETCTLRHVDGYSQSNSFAVRSGKADTDTQADCKASTTAKRNALLNCLNIVIRQDALQDEEQDASLDGAPIDFEQAETLRHMVKESGADEAKFLAYAGASKYEEIGSARYNQLFDMLQKRMRR